LTTVFLDAVLLDDGVVRHILCFPKSD